MSDEATTCGPGEPCNDCQVCLNAEVARLRAILKRVADWEIPAKELGWHRDAESQRDYIRRLASQGLEKR